LALAIVTDSTSDIDPVRAASLGLTVVPLFVVFGDRSYRDYVDMTRREFFDRLESGELPMTSQPTAKMFEEAFAPIVARGDSILCITISSYLSGTINAARAAAQHFPDAKIEIYDSQSAAGGLGMMAIRAHELASGGAALQDILDALDRERSTQRLYACIPDLSHLQRNGRIGRAQAVLGSFMKIVPVLCLKDGQVAAEASVRTFSRAQETMLDLTMRAAPDVAKARFLVMHTDAPQLADAAMEKLKGRLGGIRPRMLEILEAGPAIATHAGAGAVGIFVAQDE
jgi:DegV family protein with EDD domain